MEVLVFVLVLAAQLNGPTLTWMINLICVEFQKAMKSLMVMILGSVNLLLKMVKASLISFSSASTRPLRRVLVWYLSNSMSMVIVVLSYNECLHDHWCCDSDSVK